MERPYRVTTATRQERFVRAGDAKKLAAGLALAGQAAKVHRLTDDGQALFVAAYAAREIREDDDR